LSCKNLRCRVKFNVDMSQLANLIVKGPSTLAFFASVVPSAMEPISNSFLCFSRAITYVIAQKKLLGIGAIADGITDAKNASVDGP
jgi:hypothetical protein